MLVSQVDLWSIGIMLYEMLFNAAPFHGRNQMEVLRNMKSLNWNRPVSPTMRASITPSTWDLLMVLLKPNPRERITWNALVSHPFVDRTDLVTLDIPHPPSIQEETETDISPVSSPTQSARAAAPADVFAAAAVPSIGSALSSAAEPSDAAHFVATRSALLSINPPGITQPTFTHQRVPSNEKVGIPKVPSSENLGLV
jgi:serine/threonine protein kinase